jgi:hypothetical protein
VVHGGVLLIIRRSWVRAPPAPTVGDHDLGVFAGSVKVVAEVALSSLTATSIFMLYGSLAICLYK